jgi:hypothetical protein
MRCVPPEIQGLSRTLLFFATSAVYDTIPCNYLAHFNFILLMSLDGLSMFLIISFL